VTAAEVARQGDLPHHMDGHTALEVPLRAQTHRTRKPLIGRCGDDAVA